ncbi:MAG: histidine phosphatase family protein, partial [Bacteroidetes bacterium]|nr:histidine phosphatase family protein [Bacteroidota bacterium]
VEVWPRCYEYRATPGYPCWGARELRARYPGLTLPADFADDDWHYGDESPESGEQRAEDFVEWLRTGAGHSAARRMAVVTHGTFTRLVLCRMFGAPLELMRRLAMDNTAVSTLEVSEKGSRVLGINDTSHLIGMDGLDPVLGITR